MIKNNPKKGYSLIEITIALLILTVAILPLIGTITKDSNNAVVISNSEFVMQKARYIFDTLLDSVDFDDLSAGDPAILTGDSKKDFLDSIFPEHQESFCEGYLTDGRGQKYYAKLKVVNIPDNENIIKFGFYENPKLEDLFYDSSNGNSLAEQASNTEKLFSPTPSTIEANKIYGNTSIDWATKSKIYGYSDFFQDEEAKILMKALFLTIRWNDKNKNNPQSEGYQEFKLITHKARLKK